jgi:regulator of protease activity HflC (stomatin/prohibitin superfamily)
VILLDITILYRINPEGENVNIVHRNLQNRYEQDFIRPTARGVAREVVSGFTAEQIYGEKRVELEQQMQDEISAQMATQGLELVNLLVRDITFSEDFTASIEQAVVAQQEAVQAQRRVEQRQAEAQQAVAIAEGDRDAAIARAQGQAQSVILNAQAQAEALRLISEQIAANPMLIQYEYIQNLSDKVSLALIPSNSPFLFDFNSIADLPSANPDFAAPVIPQSDLLVTPEPDTSN